MMAANDFRPGEEMPATVPLEDHPFLNVGESGGDNDDDGEKTGDLQKEFVARLKEKKEWEAPHQTEDAEKVFWEVKRRK